MNHLLIINADGFGRTVMGLARSDRACGPLWQVKGFLDSRLDLAGTAGPIVGDPMTYDIVEGDIFLCAVGSPAERRNRRPPACQRRRFHQSATRRQFRRARALRARLVWKLAPPSARTRCSAQIRHHTFDDDLGHGRAVGSYVQIRQASVFVRPAAPISAAHGGHPPARRPSVPGARIGDGATIGAGSVVLRDVRPGVTMFGNPAKPFSFK